MARYDSILIRVWRSSGEDREQWSGHLLHFQGDAPIRFAQPDALLAHLRSLVCLTGLPAGTRIETLSRRCAGEGEERKGEAPLR